MSAELYEWEDPDGDKGLLTTGDAMREYLDMDEDDMPGVIACLEVHPLGDQPQAVYITPEAAQGIVKALISYVNRNG